MSFFDLFKSKWKRIGEDALGKWPVVYQHQQTKDINLVIRHNTPTDYRRAMRNAGWMTFGLVVAWGFVGYTMMDDAKKTGKAIDQTTGLVIAGVALASLTLPNYFAKKKMNKDPVFGQTVTEFRIRKGKLQAPGGEKAAIEHFYSATSVEHLNLKKEYRDEELGKGREQQLKKINQLFISSSCVEVRAGHRGAHLLHTIEFYNDPHQRWAGTAAAAIDYAVSIAKPASSSVSVSAFRVTERRTEMRQI